MKRCSILFVSFAFVVILLIVPNSTIAENSNRYDFGTNKEFTQSTKAADLKSLNDIPRQGTVLWDTTHGTYLNYHPFTRYSSLVNMLIDSGYTITLCGTGVHTIDLSQYDAIVISVFNSWNSAYTQEEVDSLVSYYNQANQHVILTGEGNFCEDAYINYADNVQFSYNIFDWLSANGGIFIMGDNAGCNNANINPVANAFNMTAGVRTISPSDLYFTNFIVHPIFNSVSQIYYRFAGEISASSPAQEAAWTDADEPVIGLQDESVGVEHENKQKASMLKIKIDPNPFTYYAVVQGISEAITINIYDVTGRLVEKSSNNTIGKNLKQGIYFLEIEGYEPVKVIKLR